MITFKQIKLKENHVLLYNMLLFLLKIVLVNLNINNLDSIIHLIIKGKGTQQILDKDFIAPSEVLVNGKKKDSCKQTCYLEENVSNITLKFNNQISSFYTMFYKCKNITYIDLSNFDTSNINDMRSMFCYCSNLEKINFGNIITSSVEDMIYLFGYCNKLTSIDLSNFDTSKVNYIISMFYGCSNLEKLNLSNINTSSVYSMNSLFYGCYKLTSINISNFDTSKVTDMSFMFSRCSNLTYLDLSNFNTLKINKVDSMFQNCKSLIYLNLFNFKICSPVEKENFIHGISPYTKYCINDINTKEYLLGNSLISNCSDDCFKPNKKIDIINKKCKDSCINTKYEKDNISHKECEDNKEYPVLCEGNDCNNLTRKR